jgi:molybdopterin adenylyltransferase
MDAESARTVVLTISDRCARGEQIDGSGPEVVRILTTRGWHDPVREILPDEEEAICERLALLADTGTRLILTVGGTGLSPRDRTPEATTRIADRIVPGLAELMRSRTGNVTPRAFLSRGVVATRGRCLIVNLPGSPRGAAEMLEAVAALLPHALDVMNETAGTRGAHDPPTPEPGDPNREASDDT